MIPFFRKIRKKLADENQFFKYSRYAIGEIVLVVIGILIALQINNWNEEKKRNISLKGHLRSLTQAIEHDIREQNISMGFNEFRFHSWNYILNIAGVSMDSLKDIPRPNSYIVHTWDDPYPNSLDKSYINTSLNQLNNPFIDIYFNYSAIDEINNLGVLADLENDSLKKSINDYYYKLNWRFGSQSADDRYQMAKELRVYLRDHHEISCNFPPNPELVIQAFREDPKAVIMLKDLIKTVHGHYWVTEKLRNSAIDLIDIINHELK